MNILLTSVGRRAYLVKYFKDAIGPNGKVHVSNSDDMTVAFKYADETVTTPLIYSDEYIPFLLNYCKINGIDMLLSLFDIDLFVLAKNKALFEAIGTKVVVSDPDVVSICNDKWQTYTFLSDNHFNVPKTYLTIESLRQGIASGDLFFPIIVKPRFGCGSISISVANDMEELVYLSKKAFRDIQNSYLKYESAATNHPVIYQECLKGQEYGADIINDLKGEFQTTIVRKKIAMRSGETDIAELVDEPSIRFELERLGRMTRHIANMDCDVFLVNGKPYILEMNARFGGGYPFSYMGGCNLPKAILCWMCDIDVPNGTLDVEYGCIGCKELVITRVK